MALARNHADLAAAVGDRPMMSATVIPLRAPWRRAWLICFVDGADYRGELHGEPVDDGPTLTMVGPHELVLARLMQPDVRRGLPILDPRGALNKPRPYRNQPRS